MPIAETLQLERSPPTTLVLGALSPGEEALLPRLVPVSRRWRRAHGLIDAERLLADGSFDRVLLAHARPGELPTDTPERLLAVDPEVELLSVSGAWCEGELRTGKPWDGVERVYWHQLVDKYCSLTAVEERPLVLLNARLHDSASAWIDTLEELGYAAAWARRGRPEPLLAGERLAIWDGDQLDGLEAAELASFCRRRRAAGTGVIAVFDFPRADAVAAALEIGAAAVLGRPWSLEAVVATLQGVLRTSNQTASVASQTTPAKLAA